MKTLLGKTLTLIIAAVILGAVLTALVFSFYGRRVFSQQKAQELMPRAQYLADVTADYLEGYMGSMDFQRSVATGYHVWDASLYIYNADGELFVFPNNGDNAYNLSLIQSHVGTVLAGKRIITNPALIDIGKRSADVVIGQPAISRYGNVLGAVFLVKPIHEVRTALSGLTISLLISMLVSAAIMLLPAYLGSRNLTKPLRQMNGVAQAMARGDFSVRAHTLGKDEVAQLGSTLNYLSGELSRTIGHLTFERNRLQTVLNGMQEGIVALDSAGVVTQYNPAALRLLGGGEGVGIQQLLAVHGVDKWLGSNAETLEFPVGEAVLRLTRSELIDYGQSAGVLLLLQDITESERLEQTRRDYVANVSHELKTPVAAIRGLADALNDKLVHDEKDKERYYSYILHETLRLSRLIDDLLELSRLQSGQVQLQKQTIDVREMVLDVVDRYSSVAAEHGREIKAILGSRQAYAITNPDKAEQLLVIMVDNAIKHASGEGDVVVKIGNEQEKLVIEVSNPGHINELDSAHIFERFYKADKSHSGNGTGLGLSIASEICHLLGEELSLSTGEGRVKFKVSLQQKKGECDKT